MSGTSNAHVQSPSPAYQVYSGYETMQQNVRKRYIGTVQLTTFKRMPIRVLTKLPTTPYSRQPPDTLALTPFLGFCTEDKNTESSFYRVPTRHSALCAIPFLSPSLFLSFFISYFLLIFTCFHSSSLSLTSVPLVFHLSRSSGFFVCISRLSPKAACNL